MMFLLPDIIGSGSLLVMSSEIYDKTLVNVRCKSCLGILRNYLLILSFFVMPIFEFSTLVRGF